MATNHSSKLQENNAELQSILDTISALPPPSVSDSVLYTEQELTEDQQFIARNNIRAASETSVTELSEKISDKVSKSNITLEQHTDGLIYIFVDGAPVGNGVELGTIVEGDVIGTLDDSMNILLSGNLPNGTYQLKWRNPDGTYSDAGEVVVSAIPEPEPVKTNFCVPDGDGWIEGGRCSSTGENRTDAGDGYACTNYIEVQNGDTLCITNADIEAYPNAFCGMYNSDKSAIGGFKASDSAGYVKDVDLTSATESLTIDNANAGYIRFSIKYHSTRDNVVINIKRNGEWL